MTFRRGGSNPVGSFLAGFAAVDQLETNRQRRDFLEQQQEFAVEEQSWRRKAEKRADDLYEQLKLKDYRHQKAAEFSALTDDIMAKVTAQIDAAEAAGDTETVKQLRETWFVGPGAQANLINEAWKQQIARDPTFGEHLSFAFGKDAAAGRLVQDPSKPISAAGFAMPEQGGEGHPGGVWFGVNSVNGMQPMTEFRTSADGDPIFFGQPGMAELVKVYGDSATTDEFRIMAVLRAGVGGDQPTGQPIEANKVAANVQSGNTAAVNPNAGNTAGIPAEEQERNLAELRERQRKAAAERQAAQSARATEPVEQPVVTEEEARSIGQQVELGLVEPPPSRRVVDVSGSNLDKRYAGDTVDTSPPTDQFSSGTEIGSAGLGATLLKNAGIAAENIAAGTKKAIDFIRGWQVVNTPEGEAVATTTAAPENAAQINQAAQEKGGPTAKEMAATAPETGQANKVAAPADNQVAAQVATSLAATSGTRRRPPPEEVYKAYMMQKAGFIELEDVMRFKQTGSFSEPVERKFHNMGKGQFVVTQNGTPVASGSVPGFEDEDDSGNEAALKAQQSMFNYLQDRTSGFFEDDPRGQAAYISAAEGAMTILGFPGNTEAGINARANPDVQNSLARAGRFTRYYDQDTAQNLFEGTGDFNPLPGSDYKIASDNPGALAIAYVADQQGITSQEDANEFLTQHAGEYAGAHPEMSPRELLLNVNQNENTVLARIEAGRNPKHPEHEKYKGMSRNKIRRELIEELIRGQ
jgi:hypothetical protein